MPVLKNPRHELFAQALAGGASADEAYTEAGYVENSGNASRLKGNERVASRCREILTNAADRANMTLEKLGADLEQARLLAIRIKQPSAAVQATMGQGKLYGFTVEKVNFTGTLTLADLVSASMRPAAEPVEEKATDQ